MELLFLCYVTQLQNLVINHVNQELTESKMDFAISVESGIPTVGVAHLAR